MVTILALSIFIRIVAFALSLVLLRRLRDWRMGFLALMISLMGLRQALTLHEAWGGGTAESVPPLTELPGLVVSLLILLTVVGLYHILMQRLSQEKSLRESEAQYRSLLEHAPFSVWICDGEGTINYANQAALGLFGIVDPTQIIGRFNIYYDGTEAEKSLLTYFERAWAGEVVRFDHEIDMSEVKYDSQICGKLFLTSLLYPITNTPGYRPNLVVIQEDITEQKRTLQAIERHDNELRALYQSSLAFSQLQSVEAVGRKIIKTIERMLGYQRGSIWVVHEDGQKLHLLAHSELALDPASLESELSRVRSLVAELGQGISGWVALRGESVRTGHVKSDWRYIEADPAVQSELCVPLTIGGRTIGSINVESVEPDAFTEHDERLLATLASQAAVAIENARLFEKSRQEIEQRKAADDAKQRYAERLEILRKVDQAIVAARSPEEIARAAVHHIRGLIPCKRASVVQFDAEGKEGTVLAVDAYYETRLQAGTRFSLNEEPHISPIGEGHVVMIEDLSMVSPPTPIIEVLQAEGVHCIVGLPLMSQNKLIGSLFLGADGPRVFSSEHLEVAREVGDSLAIAIQNARLFMEVHNARGRLQSLSQRLMEIQETERRSLARELHDEIGQALTAVKLSLQAVTRSQQTSDAAFHMEEAIRIVDRALKQVRDLSLDLRPSILDDLGLVSALRWYVDRQAQRAGFSVHMTTSPSLARLPVHIETACFRIVQEALTNVARHADAAQVWVELKQVDSEVQLTVRDNGRGFDVQVKSEQVARGESLGLLGMQERANLVGGRVEVDSSPGRGTEIRMRVPLTGL